MEEEHSKWFAIKITYEDESIEYHLDEYCYELIRRFEGDNTAYLNEYERLLEKGKGFSEIHKVELNIHKEVRKFVKKLNENIA